MKRIFFFLVGLIGLILRYIYLLISEIIFIVWDIIFLISIGIINAFWGLVRFGRKIMGKPYSPHSKKRRK